MEVSERGGAALLHEGEGPLCGTCVMHRPVRVGGRQREEGVFGSQGLAQVCAGVYVHVCSFLMPYCPSLPLVSYCPSLPHVPYCPSLPHVSYCPSLLRVPYSGPTAHVP